MKKPAVMVIGLVLAILALAGPLGAAPRYVYHDLGIFPWEDPLNPPISTQAQDLNNAGQVVGWVWMFSNEARPFLKNPGQPLEELELLGGSQNFPYGINEAGQVTGYGVSADGKLRAFLKTPGEDVEDLGTLGGGESAAYGINKAGQVVGISTLGDGSFRAFLKNLGQPMEELDSGLVGVAYGINDAGQIVGMRIQGEENYAWLKNPGETATQPLGTLGGTSSAAFNLNNAGQVVGWAQNPGGVQRPFLKNPDQPMQDLGTLGGDDGYAYDINNFGQVVGLAKDGSGVDQPFLWDRGSMYNLNDLAVNLPAEVELVEAWAINDRGWIVGNATQDKAFLLTPVTAPPVVELLLLD